MASQIDTILSKIQGMSDRRKQQILRRVSSYISDRTSTEVLENMTTNMFALEIITLSERRSRNVMDLIDKIFARPESIFDFLKHITTLEPFQTTIYQELQKYVTLTEPEREVVQPERVPEVQRVQPVRRQVIVAQAQSSQSVQNQGHEDVGDAPSYIS